MSEQEYIYPHPRHEIHDRIYTGTHAAKLVMEHDAEAHDVITGCQEETSLDPGDQIWFLKKGELQSYDERELYDAASPFTRRRAGVEHPYYGVDSDFKSWLVNEGSDGEIVNFFQAAFDKLRKTAITPETERLVENEIAAYSQSIEAGEREGWLATGSAQRVRSYKENPESWHWGTSQMRAKPGAEAWTVGHISAQNRSYYIPQVVFPAGTMTKYTNFVAEEGVIEKKIKATGFHEFNHAFLGGFDQKWINEAATEHVGRVLHGQVDIEGTGYGDEIAGPYGKEIKLLLTMLQRSKNEPENSLSMKDVTVAYSSLDEEAVKNVSKRFKAAVGYSFEDTEELLARKTAPHASRTEYVDTQSDKYLYAINQLTEQLAA